MLLISSPNNQDDSDNFNPNNQNIFHNLKTEDSNVWEGRGGYYPPQGRGTQTIITGDTVQHFVTYTRVITFREGNVYISQKLMNKMTRSRNGNIKKFTQIKVIHWNGGSRLWLNKLNEIEALLSQKSPDICFISESNLWDNTSDVEHNIPGYTLILPNTWSNLKHARIICLVKDDLNIHILREHMDEDTATIWLRVGTGKKSVLIGGIYREHTLLGTDYRIATRMEHLQEQERRWSKILNRWRNVSRSSRCFVFGDINLDFKRWNSPEQHLESMVDATKDVIENSGFVQLITEITKKIKFWTKSGQIAVIESSAISMKSELPEDLRAEMNISAFKSGVRTWLMEQRLENEDNDEALDDTTEALRDDTDATADRLQGLRDRPPDLVET